MSTRSTLEDRWRRGQRGWPARFPLAQLPNAPLLVASGGWLLWWSRSARRSSHEAIAGYGLCQRPYGAMNS